MVSNSVSYPDKNCNRKRKCLRNILYVLYVKLKCRRLLHFSLAHFTDSSRKTPPHSGTGSLQPVLLTSPDQGNIRTVQLLFQDCPGM